MNVHSHTIISFAFVPSTSVLLFCPTTAASLFCILKDYIKMNN